MSVNLGNINLNISENAVNATDIEQLITSAQKGNESVLNVIRNLIPGQVIEGSLISNNKDTLSLLLKNNTILNTKIEGDINLKQGQNMFFEVKSTQNGQVTLNPLFTNTVTVSTASKALEEAHINITKDTLNMVDELMHNGMPVKKDILNTFNKEMSAFPNTDIKDIIALHKLNLPVNETNLKMIEQYNNENRWMLSNVDSMTDSISDILIGLSNNNPEEFEAFINELADVLDDYSEVPIDDKGKSAMENSADVKDNDLKSENDENIPGDKNSFFDKLRRTSTIQINNPRIMKAIKHELSNILKDKMLMEPDKVADKKYVSDYYSRMDEIADKLNAVSKQYDNINSDLSRQSTFLKNNIDFINQMNDLYNYVQLPLKMADEHANGDLYVYSRKKSAHDTDEPLTALLHLSMETLGNMDIFLKLEGDRLSTRFCLEKEEYIDFIEEHIDELNVRLEKKGYKTNTSVSKSDDSDRDIVNDITGNRDNVNVISDVSFDARA